VCRGRAGGDPLPCRAPIAAVPLGGAHIRGDVRVSLPRGATPIPVAEFPAALPGIVTGRVTWGVPRPPGEDERLAA
jgi:hypothetical protein